MLLWGERVNMPEDDLRNPLNSSFPKVLDRLVTKSGKSWYWIANSSGVDRGNLHCYRAGTKTPTDISALKLCKALAVAGLSDEDLDLLLESLGIRTVFSVSAA